MILSKCKHCDGKIVMVRYVGVDELKRNVVELRCDRGHVYGVVLAMAGLTKINKSAEFPPDKTKWFKAPDKVLIGCPGCGSIAPVAAPIHTIEEDGIVKPSWTCPYGCGWHAFIRLSDWKGTTP